MKYVSTFVLLYALFFGLAYAQTGNTKEWTGKDSEDVNRPSDVDMEQGDIKAFQVRGDVRIIDKESNSSEKLSRGQTFSHKTLVVTGDNSGALLMFSNGSTVNLGANTRLDISVYLQEPYDPSLGKYVTLPEDPSTSKTELSLEQGELMGNVNKLRSTSTYEVETPVGTAGVRGTTFYVSYGLNANTQNYMMQISKIEGDVYIESEFNSDVVMNNAGVAVGEYNPLVGARVYDVPDDALVIIEADRSLDLGEVDVLNKMEVFTRFEDFISDPNNRRLLEELDDATGRSSQRDFLQDQNDNTSGSEVDPRTGQPFSL